MSNKKGFVLIETIITIVVLAASLLYIYSSFSNVITREQTRLYYDDVAYIYRTYYIKEFFKDRRLNNVLNRLNKDQPMMIIGCESDVFGTDYDAQAFCPTLLSNMGVIRVVVALSDLSYVRNCSSTSVTDEDACIYLNNISEEEITYLSTLGDLKGDSEEDFYVMIIEYNDDVENNNDYAWIKI